MKTILIIFLVASSVFSKTFLWEVSDGDSKIYLLGSVHVATEEMYPLEKVITDSYTDSEALVLEVVIDEINPMDMMMKMMLPAEKSLKDMVDADTYKDMVTMMDSLQVPAMTYERLKPWGATLLLMQMQMENEGFDQSLGFDSHFLTKARAEEKEVFGLETLDDQLNAFERLSEFSNDFFKYSIDEMENSKKMIDQMLAAWKSGDTSKINEIMNLSGDEMENYDKVTEIMLDERNVKMLEKIEDYLKENKKYFVIVGAGHLVGDKGLLNLLNKSGKYKLKQL